MIGYCKLMSLLFIIFISSEIEITKKLEEKYQAKGITLWDRTRPDLLNKEYAFEVDWAPKWAEAIGQSLYYAAVTRKKPAIILLVKDMKIDQKYVYRCQTVCVRYNIALFVEKVRQ